MSLKSKLTFFLFLIAGLGVLSVTFRTQKPPMTFALKTKPNPIRFLASPSELGLVFQPLAGTRYVYRFQRRVEVVGMDRKKRTFHFAGKYFVDVLSVNSDKIELLLSDEISGVEKGGVLKAVLNSRGKVLELKGPTIVTADSIQHESVIKDLLANWDFALESDTVGKYKARIEVLPSPSSNSTVTIKKEKLNYLFRNIEITKSEHELTWDRSLHLPIRAVGEEGTEMSGLSSDTSYILAYETQLPSPYHNQATSPLKMSIERDTSFALDQVKPTPDIEEDPFRAGFLSNFSGSVEEALKMDSNSKMRSFGSLVSLLKTRSDLVTEAFELAIQSGGDSIARARFLIGALASAGTSSCQSTLVQLYQNPDSDFTTKQMVLSALTTAQAPLESSTQSVLNEIYTSEKDAVLAQSAALALASAIKRAPDANALDALVQNTQGAWSANNPDSQVAVLDVVGNSGRTEFLSVIKEGLASADSRVRAKAILATRFISSDSVPSWIVQAMNDADSGVRGAAVQAISFRPSQEAVLFKSTLSACAQNEPDHRIRRACSQLL